MLDYTLGKIYKISSESKGLCYYGSTTKELDARLKSHRYKYSFFKNGKTNYVSVNDILDCDDAKIELVEAFPCNNRKELDKKEGEYIKNNECVNLYIPGRNLKEYYQDNKEMYKQRYNKDKDKIKQRYEERKKNNIKKEIDQPITKDDIEKKIKHKIYMNNYMKEYRLKNLESQRAYRNNYMKERYKNNKEEREKIKSYYKNKYRLEKKLFNIFEGLIKINDLNKNKDFVKPEDFSNKVTF